MKLSPGWRRFFIRSGAALVPLVTVGAALVLFASWLGAVVFLVALLLAVGWGARPHMQEAREKLRRYDTLATQADGLVAQVERLAAENERVKEAAGEATQEALATEIEEGKLQVIGSLLGLGAGPPQLIAVSTTAGELELVAQYDDPDKPVRLGTRYQLQMTATGDRKGVVQVVRLDETQRMVYLQAVDKTVPEYWERLEDAAVANPTPPTGVRLTPVQYDLPRALMPPTQTPVQRLLRKLDQDRRDP